jgi:nucleotide-binding universal stress UspA family protein
MTSARADAQEQRCLVVGYDRSDGSRHAIEWAVSELAPGDKLVITHACRALHAPASPMSSSHERVSLGRAMVDELLLEGEDRMRDLELATEVLDEDPVLALTHAAARHNARAIVLGCEPHSRLYKALGSVTSELLGSSTIPVIAVPRGAAV